MRRHKLWKKALLSVSVMLGGGTVMADGCLNTLASINLCGTVFTFCTPADQLNLFFPYLEVPDYRADPSCTIPLGCDGSDIYTTIPEGFPGGSGINEPTNSQTGVGGTGGGTGGGGI
jgi:hypothetical protein